MKKLVLTKEERHEVYKKTLEGFTNVKALVGICYYMQQALIKLYKDWHNVAPYSKMSQFPEIYKHKPKGKRRGQEWWDYSDRQVRRRILQQAIRETK